MNTEQFWDMLINPRVKFILKNFKCSNFRYQYQHLRKMSSCHEHEIRRIIERDSTVTHLYIFYVIIN